MNKINRNFKIFTMLLSLSISNCLCFSSKKYKNYDKNKINRVNYRKKKKRQLKVKYSKKNNIVKGAALLSTFALLGYLCKKCFGKNEDNNSKKKQHVDKIKKTEDKIELSEADIEFIKRNFFLVAWDNNSCWNDVFVQFLMCPDIRQKIYESEKIMNTIKWINIELEKQKCKTSFERKIPIPLDCRPIPDDCEMYRGSGKRLPFYYSFYYKYFNGKRIDKLGIVSNSCNVYLNDDPTLCNESLSQANMIFYPGEDSRVLLDCIGDNNNKEKNYIVGIDIGDKNVFKYDLSKLFSLSCIGYYPTYIAVHDDVNYTGVTHTFAYYVIYDHNMGIKYFLKADGIEKHIEVIPKDKALKDLNVYRNGLLFVLSKGDIVKKYYVPTK